jgi:hypothetical protein
MTQVPTANIRSLDAFANLLLKPEFFPLPKLGPDPFFGLSRSSYYDLERRGLLSFVRVRKPGNVRGRVLVRYIAMSRLMEQFSATGGTK